jgi:Mlc titration factor MtfA (ptsG expression regulator)
MLYLILMSPVFVYLAWRLWRSLNDALKQKRRARLFSTVMSDQWRAILRRDFALYRNLPTPLQCKLEGHINVFLQEKVFVGCNGQTITDEVRLLIAAQACLLILNKATDYYPGFETILVYPDTFVVPVVEQDGALRSNSKSARLGESWHRGPVVLAWDQVQSGAWDNRDGHNVVMHEFAHKLDEENWYMDGLPVLPDSDQYASWKRVLTDAFEVLQHKSYQGERDVIDDYGASSPAEFFAVVTETFFEKPQQLRHEHPELYEQFRLFYQLDPYCWKRDIANTQ